MFRDKLSSVIAILLMVTVGFQLYDFILKNTKPFYYHRVTVLTPTVSMSGDNCFREELDVERFRYCRVYIGRFFVSKVTKKVFLREDVVGGATKLGRTKPGEYPVNEVCIPHILQDGTRPPLGGVTVLQTVSSQCIEGMHTDPWPIVNFELVQ